MKKFFTVVLWLGLAASLIALVCVAGDKTALREENRKQKQKYEALKTMYDQEKAEWKSTADELSADNAALILEKQTLAAALDEARQEMDAVKEEQETLAAEKNEASGRLSEILAVLMPEDETLDAREAEQTETQTEEKQPDEEQTEPVSEEPAQDEPPTEPEEKPEEEPTEPVPVETEAEAKASPEEEAL